jgi:hypothetical protein
MLCVDEDAKDEASLSGESGDDGSSKESRHTVGRRLRVSGDLREST